MIRTAIFELAAARNSPLIAAAFDETTVELWDVRSRKKTGEVRTRFASGAENLALSPDGRMLVTGLSRPGGEIAAHDTATCAELWRRKGIRYPSRLRFHPVGAHLTCAVDRKKIELIAAATGHTVNRIARAKRYFEGEHGQALAVPNPEGAPYRLDVEPGERSFRIESLTPVILDACFSRTSVYLSEFCGLVRCIDCLTGSELWRFTPPEGAHVVRLYYSPPDGAAYGLLYNYQKPLPSKLLRLREEDGAVKETAYFPKTPQGTFVPAMHQFVTESGDIIELSTGETSGTLPFPQKEYPDPDG